MLCQPELRRKLDAWIDFDAWEGCGESTRIPLRRKRETAVCYRDAWRARRQVLCRETIWPSECLHPVGQ